LTYEQAAAQMGKTAQFNMGDYANIVIIRLYGKCLSGMGSKFI
jgi:hypothetical protein